MQLHMETGQIVSDTAALTNRTQRADACIVLSWEMLLMAHGAHAVSPWIAIKTTASGTEHRHWALIGLLGHSDGLLLVSWHGNTNKRYWGLSWTMTYIFIYNVIRSLVNSKITDSSTRNSFTHHQSDPTLKATGLGELKELLYHWYTGRCRAQARNIDLSFIYLFN